MELNFSYTLLMWNEYKGYYEDIDEKCIEQKTKAR